LDYLLPLLHVVATRANLIYFFLTFLVRLRANLRTSMLIVKCLLLLSDEDLLGSDRKLEFKV